MNKIDFELKIKAKFDRWINSLPENLQDILLYASTQNKIIYGGVLRRLAFLPGLPDKNVDIDIVLWNPEGILTFPGGNHEATAEGGYVIKAEFKYSGFNLDVWAIEDTWDFKTNKINYDNILGFEQIFKTSRFNLDQIYYDFRENRVICSDAFFEGFQNKTLILNNLNNRYPLAMALKALELEKLCNLNVSEELKDWILTSLKNTNQSISILPQEYKELFINL